MYDSKNFSPNKLIAINTSGLAIFASYSNFKEKILL